MWAAIKTGALFIVKNWTQFVKSTVVKPNDAMKSVTESDLYRNIP